MSPEQTATLDAAAMQLIGVEAILDIIADAVPGKDARLHDALTGVRAITTAIRSSIEGLIV